MTSPLDRLRRDLAEAQVIFKVPECPVFAADLALLIALAVAVQDYHDYCRETPPFRDPDDNDMTRWRLVIKALAALTEATP